MILSQRHSLGCMVLFLTAVYCFTTISNAAVWVSGSSSQDQFGIYGTRGVPDAANVPGSRICSVSWTDSSGNLWLFGGYWKHGIYNVSNQRYNDLWKYSRQCPPGDLNGDYTVDIDDLRMVVADWLEEYTFPDFTIISANWKKKGPYLWTWVSGSNTENSSCIYGTKGIPNAANVPGGRYGSISWVDTNNNLWLFGGYGYNSGLAGYLNDLWKFNTATGLWTWVSGSNISGQAGIYGTKGVSNASNIPGGREYSISWIDSQGNLWLFGGEYGIVNDYTKYQLNDLWKYNPATNLWTWVSGSNTADQAGVYGTKGVSGSTNLPGARCSSIAWIDTNNNLWLFGGYGHDSTSSIGDLNDLWKFNTATGLWTWVGGSNLKAQAGIYGTKGIASVLNIPGARAGAISWTDNNNNLWLYGGGFYNNINSQGTLGDLWKYNIPTNLWTWTGGLTALNYGGNYAAKGVSDPAYLPGARSGGVSWFYDNNLWLFCGAGYSNDLWKFTCEGDPGDLNSDCVVNMEDLGILASNWLDDYTLTHFGQVGGNWYRQRNPD